MTAKQLKNSILQQAIQGKLIKQNKEDEPASELLKRIKAEREKLIKLGKIKINKNISAIYRKGNSFYEKIENEEICIDEELPFEIPKTWEWVRMDNVFILNMGQSPKGDAVSEINNGIEFHQGKLFFGKKYIVKSNQKTLTPTKLAPANSILLCVRAPVGKVNITERELCIGRGLCSIQPLGKLNMDFAYYVLETYENIFIKKATGTTFMAITSEVIKNQLFPLPPIEEQKRIVNKLNQLMPLIEEYEEKENKLNELDKKFPERLKKSILKEAFDGKLIKSYNKWRELTFSKCVNIIGVKHKIKRKNYLKYGKYPIIDQSQNFISGHSSNKNILINIKKPVIIFGDHNRYFKFVDFDFIAGADGIKILEPKEFFNEKLFYYFCLSLNIPSKGYSRHYKFLTKIKMRIPPIEEQKRIVEKLDKLINACEELKKILFI